MPHTANTARSRLASQPHSVCHEAGSGPPDAIFPQSNTNFKGKASSKRLYAGEKTAFQEVEMSETAPLPPEVRKNLEKKSHYTSFALIAKPLTWD